MKKKKLNIGIQGVKGSYHHIVSEYYFEENFHLRECLSFDHLVEEIIKSNIVFINHYVLSTYRNLLCSPCNPNVRETVLQLERMIDHL